MDTELMELTNEIVTLVAQIVTIVFSIGIAIYTFQFPIWRENVSIAPEIVDNQHKRVSCKILRLFRIGIITILYALAVKVIISQFILSTCGLWTLLIVSVVLLLLAFYFLYVIFPEIALEDE